ncbi:MAG: serine/threonine protein kinase [Planctomycetes bacterium]|nr:serine/threonine protein kinase [Planctomycetota bacterium]
MPAADPAEGGDQALLATERERDAVGSSGSGGGDHGPARPPASLDPRYRLADRLGAGTTGQVWAAHDLALDRPVALKVLGAAGAPATARFIREARITAGIDHPNATPIHDLGFGADGTAYFAMRRIEGRSLGAALRAAAAGGPAGEIAELNQRITVLLKACDAIARAHARGVVHRDIKPDNIMLGSHGEVVVVDWGEARRLDEPDHQGGASAVGTPAYMSPEQARGEPADQRSDVWCLGATLWHLLTLRPPWWDDDRERFWAGKRAGRVAPLPPGAEARLPRRLLAVARKAMAADPVGRYPSVEAFAADLARFQAGQAVEALHEDALERAARWLHQHRRAFAAALLVLLAAGAGAGMWWRERARQSAGWGSPVAVEDFADDGWRERWLEPEPGMWKVDGGRLVSTAPAAAHLVLRRRLGGAVAVEFEGEMLPGFNPCDLSVLWTETNTAMEEPEDWVRTHHRRLWLQAGAYNNTFAALFESGGRLAVSRRRLEPGRRYRMRFELDGRDVRLLVDGEPWIAYRHLVTLGSGFVSLYGFFPGKAFSRVRVYQRRQPELLPALALGDEFWRQRLLPQAAAAYGQVADSLPGAAMGAEARYKQAAALWASGDRSAARRAWLRVPPGPWGDLVRCDRLEEWFLQGRHAEAADGLVRLVGELPACRDHLIQLWQGWAASALKELDERGDSPAAALLLRAKREAFPEDLASDWPAASLCLALEGPGELLRRHGHEAFRRGEALMLLGRYREVLAMPESIVGQRGDALAQLGRIDEAMAVMGPGGQALLLMLVGREDEARRLFPQEQMVWVRSGDPERALALIPPDRPVERAAALIQLGRMEEAAAIARTQPMRDRQRLLAAAGFAREAAALPYSWRVRPVADLVVLRLDGDREGELAARRQLQELGADRDYLSSTGMWLGRRVLAPLISLADGDDAPLRGHLADLAAADPEPVAGRPVRLARFVLTGDEAEIAALPMAAERELWLALGRALRAELAGAEEARIAAWAAYLELPFHRRLVGGERLPVTGLDLMAAWRCGRLRAEDLR